MIHQLQFSSNSTDGPVLVSVELPIGHDVKNELLSEPIQLDLMLLDGVEFEGSGGAPSTLDRSDLDELDGAEFDATVSDTAVPDITENHVELFADPVVAVSLPEPVADWMVQSLSLDQVGATHYVVGAPSRRRSSPPLELIGAGVLGATLLSGFAIADNAKQVAQTPAKSVSSATQSNQSINGMKPGGLAIQPSSIQPERVRPEMALPPPPVVRSKSLASMSGLPILPMTAVTSTTGSMPMGGSMPTGLTGLGLTTGPRSLRPIQLAEPTLVSVARSQAAIAATVPLPEPPAEPIAEVSPMTRLQVAPTGMTSGEVSADRPMVSQVAPGWRAPAETAAETSAKTAAEGVPTPQADRVAAPLLSPSGVPLADPVVPMPRVSLGESAAIPVAVVSPEPMVDPATVPAAEGMSGKEVARVEGVGVRVLSQAEAIAVLGARSDSEMGRFIHQSLNARDYALAAQAQQLGSVPAFGFVDYQNQRIVLPSDLTAALPGGQLQSMGVSATTIN
jgi:hypothetical protein